VAPKFTVKANEKHKDNFVISTNQTGVRSGTDALKIASQGVYSLNGVAGADLPAAFAGFPFSHMQPTDKQYVFDVHLGGREHIKIKSYKDFVSVLVEKGAASISVIASHG
jgi:hypothetical protein